MTLRCWGRMRCQGGVLTVCFRDVVPGLKNNWGLTPQAACWWKCFKTWVLWEELRSLSKTRHVFQKSMQTHQWGMHYVTFGSTATPVLRRVPHGLPVSPQCQKAGEFILLSPFTSFLISISHGHSLIFASRLIIIIKVFLKSGRPFDANLSFNLIRLASIRGNFSISFSSSCTVFSALVPLMSAAHAPAPFLKWFGHSPVNDILGRFWHLCVRSLNSILVPLPSSIWVSLPQSEMVLFVYLFVSYGEIHYHNINKCFTGSFEE